MTYLIAFAVLSFIASVLVVAACMLSSLRSEGEAVECPDNE